VRAALLAALTATLALSACGGSGDGGPSSRSQWSVFEDHDSLIREGEAKRESTLDEMRTLGADTLRVGVKWNEVAPRPLGRERPRFDATDPGDYPGFAPYDDLVRRASRMGFRILMYLAPDTPRWATADREPVTAATVNDRPDAREFGAFAGAVAQRYSGDFEDLPKVEWFSIWNEPNHVQFLKPQREAPAMYRRMVVAALPRIRDAAGGAKVLVGETAPVGKPGTTIGPAEFLRRWLCLDEAFLPTRGGGCRGFTRVDADGFAHHPYGPTQRVPKKKDVISLLAIRRLGRYLDRAARAGRIPAQLPIYNTEFGLQSNPPDPTVSTTLERQAALINEKEELSYRYPRLKSYSQYLLYDDPPRPGTDEKAVWSGFQTGLRFTDGGRKPAWAAYRLPIVVERSGSSVRIWGRVRPGEGTRDVRLEAQQGGVWRSAGREQTDDAGYFEVRRGPASRYRFTAVDDGRQLGRSRDASPAAP
jgi:hypothetical protein